MKFIEYQCEFISDGDIEYQIGIRIPNNGSQNTLHIGGVEIYDGADLINFQRSISDITDFEWKYDEQPCETPSNVSCKIKFNYDLLPDALLTAFESPIKAGTFFDNGTYYNINVYPTYLIIRRKISNEFQSIAVLCQPETVESKYKKGQDYEVEFSEIGKTILQNITFKDLHEKFSFLNPAGYITDNQNTYRDLQATDNAYKYIRADNDTNFAFMKVKSLHDAIKVLFGKIAACSMGIGSQTQEYLDYSNINNPSFDFGIIAKKQLYETAHGIGNTINFSDLYFIAYILDGTDKIGGRLHPDFDGGFYKQENNAFNYLKNLAAMTRAKFNVQISEADCGIYIDYLYTQTAYYIDLAPRLVNDFESINKMSNRYKVIASNYDNMNYDTEKQEINTNLSDNAQSLAVPMVWNSRPETVDLAAEKSQDATQKWFNTATDNGVMRYTDLMYKENDKFYRIHEGSLINLGTANFLGTNNTPFTANFLVSNIGVSISPKTRYYYEIDYSINSGMLIDTQKSGYCLDETAAQAANYSVANRISTITTYLNYLPIDTLPNLEEPISSKFRFMIPQFGNYFERARTFIDSYYHITGVSIKSLKTGEIELTIAS